MAVNRTFYFLPASQLLAAPALNLGSLGLIVANPFVPHAADLTQSRVEDTLGAVKDAAGERDTYIGLITASSGRTLVSPDDTTGRNVLIRNLGWIAAVCSVLGFRGILFDAEPIPALGPTWKFWPNEPNTAALGSEMRDAIRTGPRTLDVGCYSPWNGTRGVKGLQGFHDWFWGVTVSGAAAGFPFFAEDGYVSTDPYKRTRAEIEAAFHCTCVPGVGLHWKTRAKNETAYRPKTVGEFREGLEKDLTRARRNSAAGKSWLFPWGWADQENQPEWGTAHPKHWRVTLKLA